MLAVLGTLASIAATLALDQTLRAVEERRARSEGISSDSVLKLVKSMTLEARQKGNAVYNKLINRLNAVPQLLGMSPSLKSYITNAKNNLNEQSLNLQNKLSEVETKLGNIEERASMYASSDAATRHINRDIPTKLINETRDITNQIEQTIGGSNGKV